MYCIRGILCKAWKVMTLRDWSRKFGEVPEKDWKRKQVLVAPMVWL